MNACVNINNICMRVYVFEPEHFRPRYSKHGRELKMNRIKHTHHADRAELRNTCTWYSIYTMKSPINTYTYMYLYDKWVYNVCWKLNISIVNSPNMLGN